MITINGKNIIKVYIGNKPCSHVYSGVNPLFDEVFMRGLRDFELVCEGDTNGVNISYNGDGAVITAQDDGLKRDDIYLVTDKLVKNKSYKVSFKCSLNSGRHTLILEANSGDSTVYTIDTKEQVIEKTFSNVNSNYLYIKLGYEYPSNNFTPKFTIKDFQIIEI